MSRNIPSIFSANSEALASELPENLEDAFLVYYKHRICSNFQYNNNERRQKVNELIRIMYIWSTNLSSYNYFLSYFKEKRYINVYSLFILANKNSYASIHTGYISLALIVGIYSWTNDRMWEYWWNYVFTIHQLILLVKKHVFYRIQKIWFSIQLHKWWRM